MAGGTGILVISYVFEKVHPSENEGNSPTRRIRTLFISSSPSILPSLPPNPSLSASPIAGSGAACDGAAV